ncbi:MAG: hypothetical protein WC647_13975 [Desulfomonilaceae bacterium]|jgi:hypothetical protein
MREYDGANHIEVLRRFLGIPLGSADGVFDRFLEIPGAIYRGEGLERFLYVRGSGSNKVLLVAHADTYWDHEYGYDPGPTHKIKIEDGEIRAVNEEFGLGADDRAGCALLWLLRDLGHSLLVTNGEEHSQTGSSWLMDHSKQIYDEINRDHQFAIEFDRRNGRDFKCYNKGTEEFRAYVAKKTGYTEPDLGSSTDIRILCREIAGVNLSVGYHNEHGNQEYLNIAEWEHTLNLCGRWVAERELPRFKMN